MLTAHRSPHRRRIKANADSVIPDDVFEKRHERWTSDVPDTKEGYYIRDVFDGGFFLRRSFPTLKSAPHRRDTGLFMSEAASQTAVR